MNTIIGFFKGKKTYITAAILFTLGGLQAVGYPVPEFVYGLLGAAGLTFSRVGSVKE